MSTPVPTDAAGVPLRSPGAPPLEVVFLDLGDTLMHIHPDVPTLYIAACADLGFSTTDAQVRAALREAEVIYREAQRTGRGIESSAAEAAAFWGEYNAAILEHLGVPAEGRREAADALASLVWSPQSWRVYDDVVPVLDALRAGGLRLAVISNFTEALVALVETHALDGHFDHVLASTVVGSQKPDVGIFREALRRLDANPRAVVHVGDNYVADVLGARAAGVDGILIDRTRSGRRGSFEFGGRSGGTRQAPTLDCPVIGTLDELLPLALPG